MAIQHHLPRYDYDQCGGFGHGWAAYAGGERIAPVRVFQWQAIADLPPEADVQTSFGGRYSCLEPYRVGLVCRDYD